VKSLLNTAIRVIVTPTGHLDDDQCRALALWLDTGRDYRRQA
jgi:hypothetical protein